jgi:hypothetical protein
MASLCREFGSSRNTGYKIFERYEQSGHDGLSDSLAAHGAAGCARSGERFEQGGGVEHHLSTLRFDQHAVDDRSESLSGCS